MKRLLGACAFLALLPSLALGQEPAATASGAAITQAPIVAIVNFQRVTTESALGQQLAADLQSVQQEIAAQTQAKQVALDAQRQELDSLQTALNRDITTLTADEAEARLAVIRTKERETQAFFEDGQRELQRLESQAQQRAAELQGEYQTVVAPLLEEVATAMGVDILLDGQAALYVTPTFDISDALIERLNQVTNGADGS